MFTILAKSSKQLMFPLPVAVTTRTMKHVSLDSRVYNVGFSPQERNAYHHLEINSDRIGISHTHTLWPHPNTLSRFGLFGPTKYADQTPFHSLRRYGGGTSTGIPNLEPRPTRPHLGNTKITQNGIIRFGEEDVPERSIEETSRSPGKMLFF